MFSVTDLLGVARDVFDTDRDKSRRACEAALLLAPHSSSVHLAAGVLAHADGRLAVAEERFKLARALAEEGSQEDGEASFALGEVCSEAGKKGEAVRHYKAARLCRGGHCLATWRLANIQIQEGRLQEAVFHLEAFLSSTDPRGESMRSDAARQVAACLEKTGRTRDAAALLRNRGEQLEASAARGHAALAVGDWRGARECFSECLLRRGGSDDAVVLSSLGQAQLQLGDRSDALGSFRRCCDLEPEEVVHRLNIALLHQLMGQNEQAASCYETVLEGEIAGASKSSKRDLTHLATDRVTRTGKRPKTSAPLERAPSLRRNLMLGSVYCNLGCAALSAGQLGSAQTLFTKSLELDCECYEAHYNIGTLLLLDRRSASEAVAKFRLCKENMPTASFELLNNLGVALTVVENYVEAHSVLEIALRMRPDDEHCAVNLARAKIGISGKAEEALDLASRSSSTRALQTVLAAQVALKHFENAVATARMCLDRDANVAQVWLHFGMALIGVDRVGNAEKAKEAFRHCVDLDRDCAGGWQGLGHVLLGEGSGEEAIKCFRASIASNPSCAEGHFRLATALAHVGNVQEAVMCFRDCVKLDSEHSEAYRGWARILCGYGQLQGAERCLELALRNNASNVDCLMELARVEARLRNLAQTRELCLRVLAIDPSHAEAAKMLRGE